MKVLTRFTVLILFLCLFSFTIASNSQSKISNYKDLNGHWVRPDGGYTLVINGVDNEGNIDAEYFNPKSINVAKSKASVESDKINIYVEMQDIGYPGSYYKLTLDSETHRLVGVYYHAALKQSFYTNFMRKK